MIRTGVPHMPRHDRLGVNADDSTRKCKRLKNGRPSWLTGVFGVGFDSITSGKLGKRFMSTMEFRPPRAARVSKRRAHALTTHQRHLAAFWEMQPDVMLVSCGRPA